jgi:hypothetical protein
MFYLALMIHLAGSLFLLLHLAGKSVKSQEEQEPERIMKLKQCCDILVAGGYFRARIATLSPFDKAR